MSDAQDKQIAYLEQEVMLYSELLAQVLNVTGPVVLEKETLIDPNLGIDVDFDPKGTQATVSLKPVKE